MAEENKVTATSIADFDWDVNNTDTGYSAKEVAERMKMDAVDTVFLVPV